MTPARIPVLGPETVAAALSIPDFDHVAAWRRMAPKRRPLHPKPHDPAPVPAAVLLLLFPDSSDWRFVLTRRSAALRGHSGQISLPGGRIDEDDADANAAALRETQEELGISTAAVQPLGELSPVLITHSNFIVQTIVGYLEYAPCWRPSPEEVAEVLTMSLSELLDPRNKSITKQNLRGIETQIPHYLVAEQIVWGATALILSELECRLRQV